MAEFLQTGAVRTAYECLGSGPPIVLMHGAEASRQMFAALGELLAPHFTVITYDQRDCGETEGPAQAGTLADLADDAAALIRALGHARVHVFGSSFGGRVAQALALRHPELIDRLVLASTWPLPHTYEALYPEGADSLNALRAKLPDSAQELASWFFPEAFLNERSELRLVFAGVRPQSERSQRRARTVGSHLDRSPGEISAQTLVLTGEEDRVVPPRLSLQLADAIPKSRRLMLAGIGHAIAMQATQRVADAICEFLMIQEFPDASPS